MANDEARNRGVYSFLTREARLGNGPMIAVPVESTREAILMDAAEPIQGAIDEYLDDLADRALFQDAILAAMELNECGKYQDFLKVGQLMSLERDDLEVGTWRVHAVFEGDRYGADDKLIYGIDARKRDEATGLPVNDCQSPANRGLPLIEFYDTDGEFPEVPVDRIPAATVLGLNDLDDIVSEGGSHGRLRAHRRCGTRGRHRAPRGDRRGPLDREGLRVQAQGPSRPGRLQDDDGRPLGVAVRD